jgi:hypothetical protein
VLTLGSDAGSYRAARSFLASFVRAWLPVPDACPLGHDVQEPCGSPSWSVQAGLPFANRLLTYAKLGCKLLLGELKRPAQPAHARRVPPDSPRHIAFYTLPCKIYPNQLTKANL